MKKTIMLVLTLLMGGRAMTLAFIHRAGGPDAGDPPAAWLMPLLGDALIGVSAFCIAWLIWKHKGLWVWTSVIVWNTIGIWDALSAAVINHTNPWPEFFMLDLVGPAMFPAAAIIHLVIVILACQKEVRTNILTRN